MTHVPTSESIIERRLCVSTEGEQKLLNRNDLPFTWHDLLGARHIPTGTFSAPPFPNTRCAILVAPSGSGKTTSLKELAKANPSHVFIYDPTDPDQLSRQVATAPQAVTVIVDAIDELAIHRQSLETVLARIDKLPADRTKYIFAGRTGSIGEGDISRICDRLGVPYPGSQPKRTDELQSIGFAPLSRSDLQALECIS